MAFDPVADARRIRVGFLLAALLLLAALAFAAGRSLWGGWRQVQAEFALRDDAPAFEAGIQQGRDCGGEWERCTTCHLAARSDPASVRAAPPPFGPHPADPGRHLERGLGCTDCHGGTGRALTAQAAHAAPGQGDRDPLMGRPFIVAACGRCHVPRAAAGMAPLAAGARLYRELGCPVCHPLTEGGRGSADYGPDLRAIGRQSTAYLKDSVLTPAANFPASTMPSFGRTLSGAPESLEVLLIYLHSLALPAPPDCDRRMDAAAQVEAPCASCHGGPAGQALGRFRHRCTYLLEQAEALRCAGCHPGDLPAVGSFSGFCPTVSGYRPACVGCHPERSVD